MALSHQHTFPELMNGKKIMYVHGFMSSGATQTVDLLQQYLPNTAIIAPDLPIHPSEAMELLRKWQADERPDLIIGTSMGGMYTEMLYGTDRICVNPAFQMGATITENNMLGKQTYQHPRKDGVQEVIVTKALQKEYREITELCFAQVTPEEQTRVYGLFGDKDPIVHTFDIFAAHYSNAIPFHGAHRLSEKVLIHYLLPLIRRIDDKQEGRERKSVAIDWTTLRDDYGTAKSSLQKAYKALIMQYDVFFVTPAPTNQPDFIPNAQTWIAETFSSPAWNCCIHTNFPQFLYCDYYIHTVKTEGFMGTNLVFGSDEFKTWEALITYFERLNGQ
ncbi:MAG: YqiA/YcfP family alpha/beta fold hydrolase [Prevotella sp.]|nr:YqiA/YcfP family alpha/beta fold hydrolase [Prevotella sp.]